MLQAIAIILVFGLLIMVHELGHFLAARKAGIKVLEFSFGMGPQLVGIEKEGTMYSVRLFPIGGYVRYLSREEIGEEEKDPAIIASLREESFESKNFWQKVSVIAAGPVMNFILGAVLFIVIYAVFGVGVVNEANVIGSVVDDSPAQQAGIEAGDKIVAINDMTTNSWQELTEQIQPNMGETILVSIEKAATGEVVQAQIVPVINETTGKGMIGIQAEVLTKKVSVLESMKLGVQQTWGFTMEILRLLFEMISGQEPVELGGPVAIAEIISEGVRAGLSQLMGLTAILSIQFGILNLLPVPALDGGQLAVMTFERVRGKELSPEKKGFLQLTGFALLLLLMIAVTYQDILRLITK